MAIPSLPDFHFHLEFTGNTCCSNNKEKQIIYDQNKKIFEVKDPEAKRWWHCCSGRAKAESKEENSRTWEVFSDTFTKMFKRSPDAVQLPGGETINVTLKQTKGKKLSVRQYQLLVEAGKQAAKNDGRVVVKPAATNDGQFLMPSPLTRRHSSIPIEDLFFEIRVESRKGITLFDPSTLGQELKKYPLIGQLSDGQIASIRDQVIKKLQNKLQVTQKEITLIILQALEELNLVIVTLKKDPIIADLEDEQIEEVKKQIIKELKENETIEGTKMEISSVLATVLANLEHLNKTEKPIIESSKVG